MRETITDHDRRIANIVRIGTVKEFQAGTTDGAKIPMVKVDIGDLITDWLPVGMMRAGGNASYDTPEVGEQVLLFAPSGELANACVMGSIPQTSKPSKFTDQNNTGYAWSDGAFETYDRAGHHYILDIPSTGDLMLHVGASSFKLTNTTITAIVGGAQISMQDSSLTLSCHGASVTLSSSGVALAGTRIDLG